MKEQQLTRYINGRTYYCEALRGTKEQAEVTKNIQKETGWLARIFPVFTNGIKMYGVFVASK